MSIQRSEREIAKLGLIELITKGDDLPVFCWKMDEEYAKTANWSLYDIDAQESRRPGGAALVVKEDFSRDLAERLLEDLKRAVEYCESQPGHDAKGEGSVNAHQACG